MRKNPTLNCCSSSIFYHTNILLDILQLLCKLLILQIYFEQIWFFIYKCTSENLESAINPSIAKQKQVENQELLRM